MGAPDFNATAIGAVQQAVAGELDQIRRGVQGALDALGPWPEGGALAPADAYAIWLRIWDAEIAQAVTILDNVSTLLSHLVGFLGDLDGAAQTALGD